ncbi:accessory gene regulator ArgB-like protein [Brevibacillus fluminis]|nr:accessory gene regulator B family protein [Brevibacillus fluminis]
MSWSEKVSIRIARKLIPAESTFTVGQVSHGIELFLLYILTITSIIICSFIFGFLNEALILSLSYFLYRNFTGGVHLQNSLSCFIVGNLLVLLISYFASILSFGHNTALVVFLLFLFSFLINLRYAPAEHTYNRVSDKIKRRNKKIVIFLLFFGCALSQILIYSEYKQFALSISFSVTLQALLLHPFAFRLVKRLENLFTRKG